MTEARRKFDRDFRKGPARRGPAGPYLCAFAHSPPLAAPSLAGQTTRRHLHEDHTSCPATVLAISRWCGPLSGA